MGKAGGGGRPTIKHHQRGRRSIHDIRLNEYMNSNESRPHVVLTSGPQRLSPGSAEVRVEVWAARAQPQRDGGRAEQTPLSYRNDECESLKSSSIVHNRASRSLSCRIVWAFRSNRRRSANVFAPLFGLVHFHVALLK